jgi:hypothetical protein
MPIGIRRGRRRRRRRDVNLRVESSGATPELARSFLEGVTTGDRRPLPTVGRGTYRSLVGTAVGGELELDGKVVHLSAFPA